MKQRDYIYYDYTKSMCPECLQLVDAKIVFREDKVWMQKHCKTHGDSEVMIADDITYYKNQRNYNKQSEMPLNFKTKVHYGCPYDCGLCTDHEQHSCLSIVEITDRCNLSCPTCYANSAPNYGRHRTLEEIERMLDTIIKNEGEPDVVQISGGEPTVHPQFFEIMDLAKSKKAIKHLMLNTNGIRIAKDIDFVERLASYMPDFEIYLQFDSFKKEVLESMRGEDLTEIRRKAIENLNRFNLSTTLVVVVQKNRNEDEIGAIIDYALQQKCVRGVTFQPTQVAGRIDDFEPLEQKITLTEVRRKIYEQSSIFTPEDLIPVPCNPDALCMAYAIKPPHAETGEPDGNQAFPLTRYINPEDILNNSRSTIVYEHDERIKEHMTNLFSTGISVDCASEEGGELEQLMSCLPTIQSNTVNYSNMFRALIMNFIGAYDLDVRIIKRSCAHIVSDTYTTVPFETMNLLYRDGKINEIRKQL